MAKRFTDNEKWKDAWFMDLQAKYKLFWLYLLDECNHAGVWKVNFKVASFYIGDHLEYSEVVRVLKERITILDDNYWYIKKFIKYQYKCEIQELNIKNKAHLSVIKLLNEYKQFKPLTRPLLGVKDKDKDKDIIIDNNKIDLWIKKISKSPTYLEGLYRLNKLKKGSISELLNTFKEHLKVYPEEHANFSDFKKHFSNWLNILNNKKKLSKYQTHTKGQL